MELVHGFGVDLVSMYWILFLIFIYIISWLLRTHIYIESSKSSKSSSFFTTLYIYVCIYHSHILHSCYIPGTFGTFGTFRTLYNRGSISILLLILIVYKKGFFNAIDPSNHSKIDPSSKWFGTFI